MTEVKWGLDGTAVLDDGMMSRFVFVARRLDVYNCCFKEIVQPGVGRGDSAESDLSLSYRFVAERHNSYAYPVPRWWNKSPYFYEECPFFILVQGPYTIVGFWPIKQLEIDLS